MKKFKTICGYFNSDRISELLLKWIENNEFEILDTKLDSQYQESGFSRSGQIGAMTVIYEDHGKPIVFDYDDIYHEICKKCDTRMGLIPGKSIRQSFKDHNCKSTSNRVLCPSCKINYLNENPTKNMTGRKCSGCWARSMEYF